MTTLVRSQKQLNAVVLTTKKNLTEQGVDVTRRQVEKAISPALSGGQSHEVLSSRLKSEPSTTKGVAHKYIEQAEDSSEMLPKLSSVTASLSSSVSNLIQFKYLLGTHKSAFIKALEPEFKGVPSELTDTILFFVDMLKSDNPIELFCYEPDILLERNEYGEFDEDFFLDLHLRQGKREIYATALFDSSSFKVQSVLMSKIALNGSLISEMNLTKDEESCVKDLFTQVFNELSRNVGYQLSVSNHFSADVSPELLKMLIDECS